MKYEIQKVENIIISDSENVTTNIHFFWQVNLVKPTSLRKEILKDSSDGNDEYGCNGFSLKKYFSASHDQFLRMIVIIV